MTFYGTTDFNNDNYSYSDDSSITSVEKQRNKVKDNMKRLDPGYFTLYRNRYSEKIDKIRLRKIELYRSSRSPNHRIRNAVTGIYENLRVGKFESNLMFKVVLATGETGPDPEHLYFDSPEQYERHFKIEVSNTIKSEWQQKYNIEVDRQLHKND